MKFRIIETQELKDLTIINRDTKIEWTNDLIGNAEGLQFNNDTEEYELTEEASDWWDGYIQQYTKDDEEIAEFCEDNNIDEADFWERYSNEYNTCDLNDDHSIKQMVLQEFKDELETK